MPTYTAQDKALTANGPVVDIRVGLQNSAMAKLRAEGKPIPDLVPIRALIDTGASGTAIEPEILTDRLGLNPVGVSEVRTPTGEKPVMCARFAVGLALPTSQWWESVVVGASLAGQDIEALIGRDLLAYGVLVYTGVDGSWSLSL